MKAAENLKKVRAELDHAVRMEDKDRILEVSSLLDKYISEYLHNKQPDNIENLSKESATNIITQD